MLIIILVLYHGKSKNFDILLKKFSNSKVLFPDTYKNLDLVLH
jgi:hypothetical protein